MYANCHSCATGRPVKLKRSCGVIPRGTEVRLRIGTFRRPLFNRLLMKHLALLLLLLPAWLPAQKIEIEKRVRQRDFPAEALSRLDRDFPERKCTRYYLESDQDSTNYEAKFKWMGNRYSVEFFRDGRLKDTEKQIGWGEVAAGPQALIEAQFQHDFSHFKVKKVQVQTVPHDPDPRYEIELKGRNAAGAAFFEYLFSAGGNLLQRRKILLPPNHITLY